MALLDLLVQSEMIDPSIANAFPLTYADSGDPTISMVFSGRNP